MARYTVHVKIKHDHLGDGPSDLVVTMRGDKKILQDVENYALHYEEMSKSLATAKAELEACQKLCAIYYEIAVVAIGEEQTIALRDAAMRQKR